MGATVIVNGRTVVHETSGGQSIATPDVCLTPIVVPVPVPYVNVTSSSDATDTATSVFADGNPIMISSSSFATSLGDEAGTAGGGIMTTSISGSAAFTGSSFTVFAEGGNVPRLLDPMAQNCPGNDNGNALGPAEVQPNVEDATDIICKAICSCNWMGEVLGLNGFPKGKQLCVDFTLSKVMWWQGPPGQPSGFYHDPLVPGIWPEVPFDMGPPPFALISLGTSATQTDAAGNPLRLPYPYWGPWMRTFPAGQVKVPDVIVTKNINEPPTRDNIARVIEIKFPPDRLDDEQAEAERLIDPLCRPVLVLSPEECECGKDPPSAEEVAQLFLLALLLAKLLADAAAAAIAEGGLVEAAEALVATAVEAVVARLLTLAPAL
jgi:hypothetical protein